MGSHDPIRDHWAHVGPIRVPHKQCTRHVHAITTVCLQIVYLNTIVCAAEAQEVKVNFVCPVEMEICQHGKRDFQHPYQGKEETVNYQQQTVNMGHITQERPNENCQLPTENCQLGNKY